jgi:curved DNA-binding protein CbpA
MRPVVRAQLDYYAVLEITPAADTAEVNAAFRRLAWRYHPDRNPAPGATLQFQDINEAHQVLSDPVRRGDYDTKWHPNPSGPHRVSHPAPPPHSRRRWRRRHHARAVIMAVIAMMIVSSAWAVIYNGMRMAHSGGVSFTTEARAASLSDANYTCGYSMEIYPVVALDEHGRRTVAWETSMQNCYGGATRVLADRQFVPVSQSRPFEITLAH